MGGGVSGMIRHDFKIDVTEVAALGEPAHIALTAVLPEAPPERPIICFAKPGGGYSRGYYTCDLPGPTSGAQADWHAARGWIFVAIDHLGVGDSSLHAPEKLTFTVVAAANAAAEAIVRDRLAKGTLVPGYPPVVDPVVIGIGQSMGGCLTIVQQGRHGSYHGIASLGYSAIHTHPPVRPGEPPIIAPWFARDTLTNARPLNLAALAQNVSGRAAGDAMAWGFHYDDVSPEVIEGDLAHFNRNIHDPVTQSGVACNPWNSLTTPGAVAQTCLTPGIVAVEAAVVGVPVLVAMGERDVCADPAGEPRAYRSAPSVDLFVCPHMGHMHNFAGTRALLWQRIAHFGDWVATWKDHHADEE